MPEPRERTKPFRFLQFADFNILMIPNGQG
jgi:hypothetical protein